MRDKTSRKAIYDTFYKTVIRLLKARRQSMEVKQDELAKTLMREQAWVSKIENLELTLDLSSLKQYCDALKISMQLIITTAESISSNENDNLNFENVFEKDVKKQFEHLPNDDRQWTEENWLFLLHSLVKDDFVTFKDITALALGHLNPPQVGTQVASNENFKKLYGKGKTWQAVKKWFYAETGRCKDCGTRLELQADHVNPKVDYGEKADNLDNLTLRCRRCNVIRRASHKNGGKAFLTTESALMWLLLIRQPDNYPEFKLLCRAYGMTMADIRFQEAWAMAIWLNSEKRYIIKEKPVEVTPLFEVKTSD